MMMTTATLSVVDASDDPDDAVDKPDSMLFEARSSTTWAIFFLLSTLVLLWFILLFDFANLNFFGTQDNFIRLPSFSWSVMSCSYVLRYWDKQIKKSAVAYQRWRCWRKATFWEYKKYMSGEKKTHVVWEVRIISISNFDKIQVVLVVDDVE